MLKINAEIRKKISKNINKQIRKLEKIPAVIYGKNKPSINITIEENVITNIKNKNNIYKKTFIIDVNKKQKKVKIKSIQQHPYKERIIHIDFIYEK